MTGNEERLTPNSFKVEVVNPSEIYLLARSDAILNQTRSELLNMSNYELSHTVLDSDLLDYERTSFLTQISENGEAEYSLSTHFILSDKEKQSVRQGYLSEAEMETLVNGLRGKGLIAEKAKSEDLNTVDINLGDGLTIELELGYKNKECYRKLLVELTHMQTTRKAGYNLVERGTKSAFANKGYGFTLLKIDPKGGGIYPKVVDEDGFRKNLNLYASTYEKIIDSLHKAVGVASPSVSLELQSLETP